MLVLGDYFITASTVRLSMEILMLWEQLLLPIKTKDLKAEEIIRMTNNSFREKDL